MPMPKPDPIGLRNYLERKYADNRFGGMVVKDDLTIVINAGSHPAFIRFQKDIVPKLHEYGYVMTENRKGWRDDGGNLVNRWIKAIPITKAILEFYGMQCDRSACNYIAQLGQDYCNECRPIMDDNYESKTGRRKRPTRL